MSKSLEESIREIVVKAIEYNEEEDAEDGLTDENGDSVPDYDWTERIIKEYTNELSSLFNSSLAQYKREIIKEIKDDCFEVLFTKYLEHDDAVNATDDILAELEKLNHTDKKEGGK